MVTRVLGLGCRKGASPAAMRQLVETMLGGDKAISLIATIEGKEQEPAIAALAVALSVPMITFTAARLEQETPRLANPSEVVFRETGCHGVAESSALAAAGEGARLILEKQVFEGCTAALAAADDDAEH